MSTYISTFMLGHWLYQHPGVSRAMFDTSLAMSSGATVNAWVLAIGFVGTSALNWLVVTPWTSKIMFRRHRLEREEGKSYTDPTASQALKDISKQFAAAHSVSSVLVSLAQLTHRLRSALTSAPRYAEHDLPRLDSVSLGLAGNLRLYGIDQGCTIVICMKTVFVDKADA